MSILTRATNAPTSPGYYWCFFEFNAEPSVVLIEKRLDGELIVREIDEDEPMPLADFILVGVRLVGPLQPPVVAAQTKEAFELFEAGYDAGVQRAAWEWKVQPITRAEPPAKREAFVAHLAAREGK